MSDILMLAALTAGLSALLTRVGDKYDLSNKWDYHKPKRLWPWCRLCVTFWSGVVIIFLLRVFQLHNLDILPCLVAALAAAPLSLTLSQNNENI